MYNAEMLPPISEIQEERGRREPLVRIIDTSRRLTEQDMQAIREGFQALQEAIANGDMA